MAQSREMVMIMDEHSFEMNNVIASKRIDILEIASRRGARNVRIFGSFSRGDFGPDSDIDLLVEMDESRSLLDMAGLKIDLEELMGRRVNIVTPDSIYWLVRRKIIGEAKPL